MPNYDFSCETCGVFERRLGFDEVGEFASCPICGELARLTCRGNRRGDFYTSSQIHSVATFLEFTSSCIQLGTYVQEGIHPMLDEQERQAGAKWKFNALVENEMVAAAHALYLRALW